MPHALKTTLHLIPPIAFLPTLTLAQPNGANLLPKEEVDQVFQQGPTSLAKGRTVSDIVARHINVGEQYMGVSVVQRSKKEIGTDSASISHVDLDEIYYIAIIPKGMPHGWHEITTDSIGYLIFRGDPNKVMQEKTE